MYTIALPEFTVPLFFNLRMIDLLGLEYEDICIERTPQGKPYLVSLFSLSFTMYKLFFKP